MIGNIIATDMANHNQGFTEFKQLMEKHEISSKNGVTQNLDKLIDSSDENTLFNSQQKVLEVCIRGADLSTQTRTFKTAKQWSLMLFEEFFHQGDLEAKQSLPISFLCDRTQVHVSQS